MFLYDTGIEYAFKMILVALKPLKPLKQAQQLVKHCFKHNSLVNGRSFWASISCAICYVFSLLLGYFTNNLKECGTLSKKNQI